MLHLETELGILEHIAVLDMGDGTEKVVYGKNIYTTNMYDIAQNFI